jgi:hypothetical protein
MNYTEKSKIEIAYYDAYKSDFNEDMRTVFTAQDAIKFIPIFKLSDDISHLGDTNILDIILMIAQLKRDLHTHELAFSAIING